MRPLNDLSCFEQQMGKQFTRRRKCVIYNDGSQSHTETGRYPGWEELPLSCRTFRYSVLREHLFQQRLRQDFLSMEYICSGEICIRSGSEAFVAEAGDCCLLHAGCDNSLLYRPDEDKACSKYGLIFTGPLLPVLLEQWRLDRIRVVTFWDRSTIETLLTGMHRMLDGSVTPERFSAAAFELLLLLSRQRKAEEPLPDAIRDICDYMESCLPEKIRTTDLAARCRISLPTFNRLFREATGLTPYRWLTRRRMETAFRMLTEGKYRIKEVASSVGYSDPLYFSQEFRRFYHMAPSAAITL